jgi:hypothetical protein
MPAPESSIAPITAGVANAPGPGLGPKSMSFRLAADAFPGAIIVMVNLAQIIVSDRGPRKAPSIA